ncbi:hypothetical protein N185_18270 [Sinorhizobium sp. GW3]|nr:hypothetical protein N185_18270 [Sinorhizobium sp. GW3]
MNRMHESNVDLRRGGPPRNWKREVAASNEDDDDTLFLRLFHRGSGVPSPLKLTAS